MKIRETYGKIEPKAAKPFLKWAGGKTQLLNEISKSLPKEITNSTFTYVEPFVGSGAVLFWMLHQFPKLRSAVINDINADLINAYKIISLKPKELVFILFEMQKEYHSMENKAKRREMYYYQKRELFNSRESNKSMQAALLIFLNRTCFNGLYRVNSNNHFNVPIGNYKKPTICDEANIWAVSEALKRVEILSGDFEETISHAGKLSFFYIDPPYKPLSKTSSFNSYSKGDFNDNEQIRLNNFCTKLKLAGHKWMLSNSDPEGVFFDDLYKEFNIARVKASRSINSNPKKRGELNELLITNYEPIRK